MYYIISTQHTTKNDQFITLWKPNNAGYCNSQEDAGLYETLKQGYHTGDGSIPVKKEDLDLLFLPSEGKKRLLNHNAIWMQLGYKLQRGKLIKL